MIKLRTREFLQQYLSPVTGVRGLGRKSLNVALTVFYSIPENVTEPIAKFECTRANSHIPSEVLIV